MIPELSYLQTEEAQAAYVAMMEEHLPDTAGSIR